MGLYETLLEIDVLGPVAGILKPRPSWVNPYGKVHLFQKLVPGSPWLYASTETDRSCGLWHNIFFDFYKIVPQGCRSCWKTVWTGTTLDQLFRVAEIQGEMKLQAKCGVEIRPRSGKLGRYQAFWYPPLVDGLEGGREWYKKIADRFAKDKLVGGTDLILKRGCTEMEQLFSPSDAWDALAERGEWDNKETMMNGLFVVAKPVPERGALKICTQIMWIEYAWEHRDPTVTKKYPNKYLERPMMPELLQYQRSVHSGKDYIGWEGSDDKLNVEGTAGDRPALITEF